VPYGSPELGSHYHGQVEATESRYGTAPPAGTTPGDGPVG
jgi:dCTP deaminase